MVVRFLARFAFLSALAMPAYAESWTPAQVDRLAQWLEGADNEALPSMDADAVALRAAQFKGEPAVIASLATDRALRLAFAMRYGAIPYERRTDWEIAGDGTDIDMPAALADALVADRLDPFFGDLRPTHPYYAQLQAAYVLETDPARHAAIGTSLERWRWMPRAMTSRYLMANAATFELTLWDEGKPIERWPVVVGKEKTKTPIFTTIVTGMIFNPWWEIPSSIVAESVGAMVRNRPAEARRKGYVFANGRYRQRPGPGNSLGQVKLVMPNSYNVYLHDSPAKALFERDVRAFSHGCIRVGNAFGMAANLLSGQTEWDMARIDKVVASGVTTPVSLARTLPVYIVYFTAEPEGKDSVRVVPDIYERDASIIQMIPPPVLPAPDGVQ